MSPPLQNLILRALGEQDRARLLQRASRLELAFAARLYDVGDAVHWVYFPEGALLSMVISTEDGRTAESGMVGYESALGLVEACGTGAATASTIVQVAGSAWKVPAAACRELSDTSSTFRQVVWAQIEFQLVESRQSATCRSFHPVEARLARWLLESRDRDNERDDLPMTQEFLANMLGVQRTTVTAFAGELQKKGLIEYSRGRLRYIDLEGLEDLACECRKVLIEERRRLGRFAARRVAAE